MTPRRRSSRSGSIEHAGKVGLEDTAVVRKDADGKVTFHNEASSGTETGAAVGAVLGGLLFVVFPVGAIVGGAIAGGLVGRAAAPGIDGAFVKEVGEDLPPGGSALFLQVKDGDPGRWSAPSDSSTAASARPRTTTTSSRPSTSRCADNAGSADAAHRIGAPLIPSP